MNQINVCNSEKKNLRKDFFLTLSLQSVAGNQADAHDTEKAALDVLHNDIKVLDSYIKNKNNVVINK